MQPVFFDPAKESLEDFKTRVHPEKTIDAYATELKELFLIRNPRFRFDPNYQDELATFLNEHFFGKSPTETGSWVFFPWNATLVHYLPKEMHEELRTARNKNLITKDEQEKFYNAKIGVAGLSVGSHVALTIAMMGGCRLMKLADPDELSGSNLNRIRGDFTGLGEKKIDLVSRQIYQMNPYAEIHDYPEGVNEENIGEFMNSLDIIVDELDNFEMKIRLRLEAKKRRIPLIMATDNGDNVICDIERYDLDENFKIFNGALGDFGLADLAKTPPADFPKIASRIAGPELVVPRMMASVMEVGKTLYSWPQLGDAATLSGVVVAYLTRKIALGEEIKSGKLEVNLDKIFCTGEFLAGEETDKKKYLEMMGLE
ncbi:MAG TPA: ThiF family adenylyltransferase [Candidatus Paceibacterota bacterium]